MVPGLNWNNFSCLPSSLPFFFLPFSFVFISSFISLSFVLFLLLSLSLFLSLPLFLSFSKRYPLTQCYMLKWLCFLHWIIFLLFFKKLMVSSVSLLQFFKKSSFYVWAYFWTLFSSIDWLVSVDLNTVFYWY